MNPELPDARPSSPPTSLPDSPPLPRDPCAVPRGALWERLPTLPGQLTDVPHVRVPRAHTQFAALGCHLDTHSDSQTPGLAGDPEAPLTGWAPSRFHGTLTYPGTPASL